MSDDKNLCPAAWNGRLCTREPHGPDTLHVDRDGSEWGGQWGAREQAGAWEPGPESFTEDDRDEQQRPVGLAPIDAFARSIEDGPRARAAGRAFLAQEHRAAALFSEQVNSYANALSRSSVAGKGFLSPAAVAAAPGIGNAIHAAMEAEAAKVRGAKGVRGDRVVIDEAIDLALKPGALPEPFGALNLTEWTAVMLADWQDATITSAELLTLLDEMLDRTIHSDACHIDPDDTTCVCVIGQLRSVLPPCPIKQPPPSGEGDLWSCTRKAHPASPDRHVWSNR